MWIVYINRVFFFFLYIVYKVMELILFIYLNYFYCVVYNLNIKCDICDEIKMIDNILIINRKERKNWVVFIIVFKLIKFY